MMQIFGKRPGANQPGGGWKNNWDARANTANPTPPTGGLQPRPGVGLGGGQPGYRPQPTGGMEPQPGVGLGGGQPGYRPPTGGWQTRPAPFPGGQPTGGMEPQPGVALGGGQPGYGAQPTGGLQPQPGSQMPTIGRGGGPMQTGVQAQQSLGTRPLQLGGNPASTTPTGGIEPQPGGPVQPGAGGVYGAPGQGIQYGREAGQQFTDQQVSYGGNTFNLTPQQLTHYNRALAAQNAPRMAGDTTNNPQAFNTYYHQNIQQGMSPEQAAQAASGRINAPGAVDLKGRPLADGVQQRLAGWAPGGVFGVFGQEGSRFSGGDPQMALRALQDAAQMGVPQMNPLMGRR